jgi:L-2,4-diaminobutyrate decarboxylase
VDDASLRLAFGVDHDGLRLGLDLLESPPPEIPLPDLDGPPRGADRALRDLAGAVLPGATHLDDPGFYAHMDPVTPWVTWVATMWAARMNQNLLHTDTGAVARDLEQRVMVLLAPYWGMNGGHLVPGSSMANLTALWAARDLRGVTTGVASENAQLSVRKAADVLGLRYRAVPVDAHGRMDLELLGDMSASAVVLTAGTTSTGTVDPLGRLDAPWVHVDAAWSGPLRLSQRWSHTLDGVANADSVAVSAHKWLHQPKESALVMFKDTESAHSALSYGAAYLAVPNVGLQGSHGYAALPLAATILAYGVEGIAAWIDHEMALTEALVQRIEMHPLLEQWDTGPGTGVVAWRHTRVGASAIQSHLQNAFVSVTTLDGEAWLRSVSANPFADPDLVADEVLEAAERATAG